VDNFVNKYASETFLNRYGKFSYYGEREVSEDHDIRAAVDNRQHGRAGVHTCCSDKPKKNDRHVARLSARINALSLKHILLAIYLGRGK
jgi:hypothetical protein